MGGIGYEADEDRITASASVEWSSPVRDINIRHGEIGEEVRSGVMQAKSWNAGNYTRSGKGGTSERERERCEMGKEEGMGNLMTQLEMGKSKLLNSIGRRMRSARTRLKTRTPY